MYLKGPCIPRQQILVVSHCYIGVTTHRSVGRDSAVGIATCYGLDGPRIESRWGHFPHPPKPALGPTQLPIQWVPSLSRG